MPPLDRARSGNSNGGTLTAIALIGSVEVIGEVGLIFVVCMPGAKSVII
jgi:hypothetical protein